MSYLNPLLQMGVCLRLSHRNAKLTLWTWDIMVFNLRHTGLLSVTNAMVIRCHGHNDVP